MVTCCKGLWVGWIECFDLSEHSGGCCGWTQYTPRTLTDSDSTSEECWRLFTCHSVIKAHHCTVPHWLQGHVVICVYGSADCCITSRLWLQHACYWAMANGGWRLIPTLFWAKKFKLLLVGDLSGCDTQQGLKIRWLYTVSQKNAPPYCEHFENRSRFDEIIVTVRWCVFWDTA